MPERKAERQTVTVVEAGRRFAPLLDLVAERETCMVVERDGVAVAAIVPIEDLRTIDRLEAERDADLAVLDRIGAALTNLPDEEIEREVAGAIAEVRAERRGQEAWRREAREVVAAMREPFTDVPSETIEREVAQAIAAGRREHPQETAKTVGRG